MMEVIFWLCVAGVVYIYIGYPVIIKLLSVGAKNTFNEGVFEPTVSILIAAYNEERDIKQTIQNKLDLDYPKKKFEIIVVSDESEDSTDEIVRAFSGADVSVRLVRQQPRQGKTAGLNLIAPMAMGEILVFSDANSIYQSDALKQLVKNFYNPEIGYVTGKMIYVNADGSIVGDGCSAYMKYENFIRSCETRIGSVIGVDGGIDAMRKTIYKQLNSDQLPDFVQPLKVISQGYKVVYESKAILKENTVSNSDQEYRMRVRVALRAMWALHDMRHLLNPFRFGMFSFQLISHKLLRYFAFVPLIILLILNIILFPESMIYKVLMTFQCLMYCLAYIGFVMRKKPNNPVYITLPYYFILLNVASAHAFMRYIKGEKQVMWRPRAG